MDYQKRLTELQENMKNLGREIPDTMNAFQQLHKSGVAEGALSTKFKELISLGIAITVRCDGCIAFHVHGAIDAGANHDEIVETIGVAVLMGGGPSVVYGCEALDALEQFHQE